MDRCAIGTYLVNSSSNMGRPRHLAGALCGLGAAALFGVSAPLCKLLLPGTGPLVLAALLYLGAGLAITLARPFVPKAKQDACLKPTDVALLLGVIACGGVAGPLLMLTGLQRVSGVAGSLLLNLEGPFTVLLAVALFRERLGIRGVAGALLIFGGAALLGVTAEEIQAPPSGVLAIAGACLAWAVDNNLSQKLSLRTPLVTVQLKALSAGVGMTFAAWLLGAPFPSWSFLIGALVVGSFSYGLSIVLDMYALRWIGAAREAAYFATAPFLGTLLAVLLLGETFGGAQAGSLLLMAAGVSVLFFDRR